jgi:hypothetical protein
MAQKLLRQLQDFSGHRRREQQCLALSGQGGQDALHVGPESHVQHAVRFVEHEHLECAEAHGVVPHVIHQPPGCRNDDVDVSFERLLLLRHRHAPKTATLETVV